MNDIVDLAAPIEPTARKDILRSHIFDIVEDVVPLPSGTTVKRSYMTHRGAVAILALRGQEGNEEVLLERQYRHPVGAYLWEIPAGLLDIDGEDPLIAAQRELAEEADLQAKRWDVLVDYFNSPGCSNESVRVFLARDLSPTPQRYQRLDEEAEIELCWVSLDEAVAAVMRGAIHNPSAVSGILAAAEARRSGFSTLRAAESPWFR
ncbi:NUDIX hydrolase [Schaalia suimastitidis]|uniref:NUDIX domain-containing protein n=1 Tax=Schaalia suimastitidis TaxID=121163 RepID=UPI0003F5BB6C